MAGCPQALADSWRRMCSLGTPVEGDVSVPYSVYLPIKWGRHPEGQVSTVTLHTFLISPVFSTHPWKIHRPSP